MGIRRTSALLLTALAALTAPLLRPAAYAGGEAPPDVALVAGQKANGDVAFEGEEDRIRFELVEGALLTVKAKGDKKTGLVPEVDLVDVTGATLPVDPGQRKNKKQIAMIKKWPVPATGTYYLAVRGTTAGPTGGYSLVTAATPAPQPAVFEGAITHPGTVELTVDADAGSRLDLTLKATKGSDALPHVMAVLGPGGASLDLDPPVRLKDTSKGQIVKKVTLPDFGRYRIQIVTLENHSGNFTAKLKVKAPIAPKTKGDFLGFSGGEAIAGAITRLVVSPRIADLGIDASAPFTARALHADGIWRDATRRAHWSVSNRNAIEVSNGPDCGTVTGVAAGGATVLAWLDDAEAEEALVLVGGATVDTLTIVPGAFTLPKGESAPIAARATFANADPDAASADVSDATTFTPGAGLTTSGARVKATGAPGAATLGASLGGVAATDAAVTVAPARVVALRVEPPYAELASGARGYTVTAVLSDGTETDVSGVATLISDHLGAATVSASTATFAGRGTAGIRAVLDGVTSRPAVLNCGPLAVSSLEIVGAGVVPAGGSRDLRADAHFEDGGVRDVAEAATWSSDTPTVVDVSIADGERGRVRALDAGEDVVITASLATGGGAVAAPSFLVDVGAADDVELITVPTFASVGVGETIAHAVLARRSDGTLGAPAAPVTVTPSNAAFATRTATGYSGVANGGATFAYASGALRAHAVIVSGTGRVTGLTADAPASGPLGAPLAGTTMVTFTPAETAATSLPDWFTDDPLALEAGPFGSLTPRRAGVTGADAVLRGFAAPSPDVTGGAPAPSSFAIFPAAPLGRAPTPVQLAAQLTLSDGGVVDVASACTWTGGGPAASVNATGRVTPLATGTAGITATHAGSGSADTVTFRTSGDEPTISGVNPSAALRGATGVVVTITGTNLNGGNESVSFGAGITVTAGPTPNGAGTQATVTIDVAGNATFGSRDVMYTTFGGSDTASAAFGVTGAAPTVASVTPANAVIPAMGSTPTGITVTGTNFLSGDTITLESHTGVSISNVTFVNSTTMTATVDVASTAAIARLDVNFVQTAAHGAATATLTDGLKIGGPDPVVTAMQPDHVFPGTQNATGRIVGQNLLTGINASFESASGVTITNVTRVSSTLITYTISVTPNASPVLLDLTLTNPGDVASTLTDALVVAPRDPTVIGIAGDVFGRGLSQHDVTITGTGFRSGATVASSGDDVSFSNVTVTSSEQIDAKVAVASGAALGTRDLIVRHAASEGARGGTLTAAFTITDATPTLSSIVPATIGVTGSSGPTRRVELRLTGTSFVSGATITLTRGGGSGLSVVSGTTDVKSSTSIVFEADLQGTATSGAWDVTVTNPGGIGNSGSSGQGALSVVSSSTLAVNRVISDNGSAYGGERVTVYGSGFAQRCQVEFGGVKSPRTQWLDANTLACEVPAPADPASAGATTLSRTDATTVDVRVTNDPSGSPTSATLTGGYAYAADDLLFEVRETFPAQASTGVPPNLKSAVMRLSVPANTATAVSGGTQGTHCFWFESGALFVSNRTIGFGADRRFLVFSRTGGGNLPTNGATNPGRYVLDVATAVKSPSGTPLTPARLASSGNHDQWYFTIGGSTDSTAPTLSTISPSNSATNVATNSRVVATFSEALDPLTVTTSSITLAAGATNVACDIRLSDDLRSITLTPFVQLATSTSYTVTLTSTLGDLSGNTLTQITRSFTTGNGSDSTSPTISAVVFDAIRPDMDGAAGYVSGHDSDASGNPISPGSAASYDLYLARDGWTVRVEFDDDGGSGIDETTFSAKASVSSGSTSPNTELASKFDVSSTRAIWTVSTTDLLAVGENVTLTFLVKDMTGNTSSSSVVTIDVADLNSTALGAGGGDLDPFDTRQTWVLRSDTDVYTATFGVDPNDSSIQTVTTTASSNGIVDLDEALRVNGMWTPSMSAAAAAAVNGSSVGTNAIVRRLFVERARAFVRARYGIGEDGARDADDPNVEFLIEGEQGSLSSPPQWSNASTSNSARGFSEMELGGDTGPNSSGTGSYGTVGIAFTDLRNRRNEANMNAGSAAGLNDGIFVLNLFKFSMNSSTTLSSWGVRVLAHFQAAKGGTPIGQHSDDGTVLADTFDRASGSNTQAQNDRYDAIMDAIEASALSASGVIAHEIGHSSGLVPDGAPKTGFFGWAHRNNAFTEATSSSPNTANHLDYVGNDIMSPSSSTDERLATGADFARFNPYNDGYLRHRQVHDEGK